MSKSHSAKLIREIINGESNPFHIIEATQEQLGSLSYCYHHPDATPLGVEYHLKAARKYVQEILNIVAALHPELYLASDGDMEALSRVKTDLENLAKWHDNKWQLFMGEQEQS